MKSVVILSGPPGAGKTTVARELVAEAPDSIIYIEGDTFWSFIAKGTPNQPRHQRFRLVMSSMLAATLPFARAGYEVIVDFSIPPWFLDTARKIVGSKDIPLDYVVLRPSESVCATRASARKEGVISDYAQYHELYTSFDGYEKYTIQNEEADPTSTAKLIREGLSTGLYRLS